MKWAVWMLAVCLLAGCGAGARNETSPSPQNNPGVTAQQTAPQKKKIGDPNAVAAHLESLATGIAGVKDARCVVIGNTAVVGIDVDERLDRGRVGTIKYSVAEALRHDPYGVNAFVTADMDLAARIREMRADIDKGRPAAGFAEEMSDIIGRIIPQLPRDASPGDDGETGQS